jgi:putative MATE family efflux protein
MTSFKGFRLLYIIMLFFPNIALALKSLIVNRQYANNTIKKFVASSSSHLYASTSISSPASSSSTTAPIKVWPCGDQLDKRIMQLALPAYLNLAILPLVGAADTFWVGRMGNALTLAGQAAANQIFSSAFWIISFLPSVVTPLVAKAAAAEDQEAVQARVAEAAFLGLIMGAIGMALLTFLPDKAISIVLPTGTPARKYAEVYLAIRAITFVPALLSTIAFAAFRGTMDVVTPLKISILSNIINVCLDPLLIFKGGMGVGGAAAATCVAESVAFILYLKELSKKNMIKFSKAMRFPSLAALKPMLVGGLAVQMRAVSLNIAFLAVTRTTQALDTSGTAAGA